MTPTKSVFNLDNIDSVSVAAPIRVVVAVDDNGDDVCGFLVAGKNSPQYQLESQRIRADALRRASNRKSALEASTEAGATALAKAIDANELALAKALLVDWFGFGRNGIAAPFDAAVAHSLVVKYPTWRDKIIATVEADANFIRT